MSCKVTPEEAYKKEIADMTRALYVAYSKVVELQQQVSKQECRIETLKEELSNWRLTNDRLP
tara:strand:+ start:2236 stop:2421 length:186 start_codon:yes stop_codon:yes gene_type:complete